MKALACFLVGVAMAAPAAAGSGFFTAEQRPGELASAAINKGDWVVAEQRLLDSATLSDPARMINLGQIYMNTGRSAQAIAMWRKALDAKHHYPVTLLNGEVSTTDAVARVALARYGEATFAGN